MHLSPLAADPPCQLDVLGHDGHPLGVDGAQVSVLEEPNKVGLGRFLESSNSGALETQIGLEVLCDLTHQALEWELPDEELGGLLVATDLTQGHCAWPVAVRLLDTTGGWGALPCGLGRQLLPWGLASGRLTGSLLGTSHCAWIKRSNRESEENLAARGQIDDIFKRRRFIYKMFPPKRHNRARISLVT